jgi:acyl-CoA thioester hydrolase
MAEPSERWPDLAGRIDGDTHILPVRVYHEDTDFTGLVYHGALVRFFERGRSDFVRLLGIGHSELLAGTQDSEPAAFVVRHMEIDFLKPAGIGDVLEVVTQCEEIGGATLTLLQEVMRDGALLTRARVKIVLLSQSGKPVRISKLIRGSLERFLNQES